VPGTEPNRPVPGAVSYLPARDREPGRTVRGAIRQGHGDAGEDGAENRGRHGNGSNAEGKRLPEEDLTALDRLMAEEGAKQGIAPTAETVEPQGGKVNWETPKSNEENIVQATSEDGNNLNPKQTNDILNNNDILVSELKKQGLIPKDAVVHLQPRNIDTSALSFNDLHINSERGHNVTKSQAVNWIEGAKISFSIWNGKYEKYYGDQGAVYINMEKGEIKTAFSTREFDEKIKKLLEEMKNNAN
jgi:hypothetical protein